MMIDEVLAIGGFFFTVIVLSLGIPLVRSWVRRQDRTPIHDPAQTIRDERLGRIEQAIDAMAIEVERISEGQRFVTKLLAERERPLASLPAAIEKDS